MADGETSFPAHSPAEITMTRALVIVDIHRDHLHPPAPVRPPPDRDSNDVSLAELTGAGKTVVLCFSPKADTPG